MQRQELSNNISTTPDSDVTREVVSVTRETVDHESRCHESHCDERKAQEVDKKSKTENSIQGTKEIEASNDEELTSEEAVNEYKRLLEVQKKNEEIIALAESELEEQNKLMDEFYEEYDNFDTCVTRLTGEAADMIRMHNNHNDEVDRLRVEHYSQIISADMLHAENEEMKEQIYDLYEELLALKELQEIGADKLRAEMERMQYYRKELAMQSEISKCEIKLMRNDLNSKKMELDRGIKYTSKKMMTTAGNDIARSQTSPSDVVRAGRPCGVPRLQLNVKELRDITVPLPIYTPRIGYMAEKIKGEIKFKHVKRADFDKLTCKNDLVKSERNNICKWQMGDNTKIPEPEFHPYGSAKRDVSRYRASGGYLARQDYVRDDFVLNGQKHVAKSNSEYMLAMDELCGITRGESVRSVNEESARYSNRSKGKRERSADGRRSKKAVKSKIDTGLRIRHAQKKMNPRKEIVQRKSVRQTPQKAGEATENDAKTSYGTPRKKHIKAKINTGLNEIRAQKKDDSARNVDANQKKESRVRIGNNVSQMKGQLPALKSPPKPNNQDKTKLNLPAIRKSFMPTDHLPPINGNVSRTRSPHVRLTPVSPIKGHNRENLTSPDMPRSFTTSTPLPSIRQKMDNTVASIKEEIKNTSPNTTVHDKCKKDNVGAGIPNAEALWFSFSPSPPPSGAPKRKARRMKPKLTSDKCGT